MILNRSRGTISKDDDFRDGYNHLSCDVFWLDCQFASGGLLPKSVFGSQEHPILRAVQSFAHRLARTVWSRRAVDGDDTPRIPEPMVFDLVRPLNARRGEAEVNVLGVFPLNRNLGEAEWAPEVEIALADGFAIEFELPFEEWSLKAYKFAGQLTFGTAFKDSFIHGAQGILEYDKDTGNVTPTLLYLAGVQFDEKWSALAMAGLRTELEGDDRGTRTETLFNFSLFRHVGDYTTVGLETNYSASLVGGTEFRLMPQVHQELQDHIMIQFGAGCLFTQEATVPEAAARLIYSF